MAELTALSPKQVQKGLALARDGVEGLSLRETPGGLPPRPMPERSPPASGMPASGFFASPQRPVMGWREVGLVLLTYLGVGLLLRGATLGFPVIHIDEQFYLLVGDRMLHGQLPFVDIWDRKPLGLFLVFAAIRLLGGDGIVQYQMVALVCVALTSLVIYRIARAIAPRRGAWWAGVAYQCYLSAFFCFGGQAPVYYNLLVALAGLGMLKLYTAPSARHLFRRGLAVMALIGIALQIKYTVVFEGGAFGLALMWHAHQLGWRPLKIGLAALGWCLTALAPTLAAWGYYVEVGHGTEFMQANFLSIFGRHEEFLGSLWRLTKETAALTPFWLAIFWAPRRLPVLEGKALHWLHALRAWGLAAVVGFLAFGTWYDHYVAPLLVPLSALCAPALGRARPLRWLTWLTIGFGMVAAAAVTIYNCSKHGSRDQVTRTVNLIRDAAATPRGQGCVYINEGDPILYHLTGACFATSFIFPNHLNGMVDVDALGVDAAGEVARIMASHPQAVVMTAIPSSRPVNWQTRHMMFEALKRDYDLYGGQRIGWREMLVYRLKPRPAGAATQPVLAAR